MEGVYATNTKLSLFHIVPPPIILVTSIVFAVVEEAAWVYLAASVLYVALNIASFPIRKQGCSVCVMREVCSGSAAKSKDVA